MSRQAQNEIVNLEFLAAAEKLLSSACGIWLVSSSIIIVTPILLAFVALKWPLFHSFSALTGIVFTFASVAFLSQAGRTEHIEAAKCSETFNRRVMGLTWNRIVLGKKPCSTAREKAIKRLRAGDPNLTNLRDWFPSQVFDLPVLVKQIVVQLEFFNRDLTQRKSYTKYLLLLSFLVFVAFVYISLFCGFSVEQFIVRLVAPCGPLILWLTSEVISQHRSIDRLKELIHESEISFQNILQNNYEVHDHQDAINSFQDEIYRIKAESPVSNPFLCLVDKVGGSFSKPEEVSILDLHRRAFETMNSMKRGNRDT